MAYTEREARDLCEQAYQLSLADPLAPVEFAFWDTAALAGRAALFWCPSDASPHPYLDHALRFLELNAIPADRSDALHPPAADPRWFAVVDGRMPQPGQADPGHSISIPNFANRFRFDSCGHGSIWTGGVADCRAWYSRFTSLIPRLADETSRTTAYIYVTDYLNGFPFRLAEVRLTYDQQYWGTGLFKVNSDEVIADIGAFDGDTLEKYCATYGVEFRKWFAFEADLKNAGVMMSKVAENPHLAYKEVYVDTRVGWKASMDIPFAMQGNTISHITASGEGPVRQAVSLDDYFAKSPRVSIIKTDVEGADFSVLEGGRNTIATHKPKLLLSCYHHFADFVRMFEFIESVRPDYRFYLRNHSWANQWYGDPGAQFCETVLYAI